MKRRENLVKPVNPDYNLAKEIEILRGVLNERCLTTDEEFFNKIKAGDIIELYSYPGNIQVYSNEEFKRLCSYTEDQMKKQPFTVLFWRADEISEKLIRRSTQVMLNEKNAVPWQVENHEVVESLHPRRRTFEMEVGWLSPCIDIRTGERKGFISTLQVALIYEWADELLTA